jgi:hypothetical protein
VFFPSKASGNIVVLYILIFTCLDSKQHEAGSISLVKYRYGDRMSILTEVFWDFLSPFKRMRYGTLNQAWTAWTLRPTHRSLIILQFNAI